MMRCQIKIDYVIEVFFLMYIFLVLHQLPVFICITDIECYDLWSRTLFWYTLYQLYHASISVSRIFFSCILSLVFFINLCQYVKSRKEQNKLETNFTYPLCFLCIYSEVWKQVVAWAILNIYFLFIPIYTCLFFFSSLI